MIERIIARLRNVVRRRTIEFEVDEELDFHVAQETDANIARGISPAEARRIATRDLELTQTRDSIRDVRSFGLDAVWQDFCQAAHRLLREPAFTLVAVLTLTLAVGVNTAILGIADAVLFRPLPYKAPDRVFILQMMDREVGKRFTLVPYSFIDAINQMHGDVSNVAISDTGPRVAESTPDGPRVVPTLSVSRDYFALLGVNPARGRFFDAQDVGHEDSLAMLSYSSWKDRFGGDEAVIGKSVRIGDRGFDVIGVMPPKFVYPTLFRELPEVITLMKPVSPGTNGGAFYPIVRIPSGVSPEKVEQELEAAVSPVAAADPQWKKMKPVLGDMRAVLFGLGGAPIMRFLLASAVLILLIGCANLANLLLVRGHRHTRETAMRLALGAGRSRVIMPVVMEALIIGSMSGGVAVLAAASTFGFLLQAIPPLAYRGAPVGIDVRVAAIAMAVSLVSAVVFAVVPAWRASRLDALTLLRGRLNEPIEAKWRGRPLVAAQVALSVLAAFGAFIATRTFVSILRTPLGFSPEGIVQIVVAPPVANRPALPVIAVKPTGIELRDPQSARLSAADFYLGVLHALKNRPGVESVGASTGLPLGTQAGWGLVQLPGSAARTDVGVELVLPGFFETIGVPLLEGRLLTEQDLRNDAGPALISKSAATALFGSRSPLGQTFLQFRTDRLYHIVGVVADVRQDLSGASLGRAYVLPDDRGRLDAVVRVRTHNDATLHDLKAAVHSVAPDSLVEASWWADSISETTPYRNPRFQTIVLGSMSLLALMLTAVGTFGVVNYVVLTRTREMGIRLAVGAAPKALVAFVLRGALVSVASGLAIGLFAIRWMRPLAEAQLVKLNTHDPVTLVASVAVVGLTTIIAAYFPARKASTVDPVAALRAD